jgi:hypothetical protein
MSTFRHMTRPAHRAPARRHTRPPHAVDVLLASATRP